MKNILVPCDFSDPAINAFRLGLQMAQKSDAKIHLMYAIELPVLNHPLFLSAVALEGPYKDELSVKVTKEFEKVVNKYRSEGENVEVIYHIEFGSVYESILDIIKVIPIDLVITGSHGSSGIRELFLGSNAEKIVRRSPVPVLIVKNHFKGKLKNIVFPSTLEIAKHEDLVMKVKQLQDFFQATLHIVFINTPANFENDHVTFSKLDAFARHFMLKNYTLNIYNASDEESGIVHFTKKVQGDLIVMGTHSRRGLNHLMNGSIAEDVTNHTDTLIWTYSTKDHPVEA